jgi:hypothetical protein
VHETEKHHTIWCGFFSQFNFPLSFKRNICESLCNLSANRKKKNYFFSCNSLCANLIYPIRCGRCSVFPTEFRKWTTYKIPCLPLVMCNTSRPFSCSPVFPGCVFRSKVATLSMALAYPITPLELLFLHKFIVYTPSLRRSSTGIQNTIARP